MMRRAMMAILAVGIALSIHVGAVARAALSPHQAKMIEQAAPAKARVKPKARRRVLIWNTPPSMMAKNPHKGYCVPQGAHAMKTLGLKTGAFEPVVSDDIAMLAPDRLKTFDAIVLNNSNGHWVRPTDEDMARMKTCGSTPDAVEAVLKKSIMDFVHGGGGIVCYHHGMAANPKWPEFREMLGAGYAGHPWNEEIGVTVEEPDHPLVAAFGGKSTFRRADEIFQYREPYDRTKCRVLLSIDTSATNMTVKWINRKDGDFALCWVKSVGKGRIFYTTFGHRTETWWDATMLQFYLDAIQFACGDIEAPTAPRPAKAWHTSKPPKGKRDQSHPPTPVEMKKLLDALPTMAPGRPAKPRKVLVWGRPWTHQPNLIAAQAFRLLGKRTGAYKAVLSDDPEMFDPKTLATFDAVILNNLHERDPLLPDGFSHLPGPAKAKARARQQVLRKSLLDFVRSGKGAAGVHAATAACQQWPEYGEMIGGFYGGHIHQEVTIKLDAPDHPDNAAFGHKPWKIRDEVYLFRSPYDRAKLTVLLSLDLAAMADPGKRPDKDYAVSWVKPYGKGRVFYCTLGHDIATYYNPQFLQHVLAGIQYAIGDLKVGEEK